MALTKAQKKELQAQANHLSSMMQIGKNNITDSLLTSLDNELESHELVKITLLKSSSLTTDEAAQTLCEKSGAELVQSIGKTIILYRPSQKLKEKEEAKARAEKAAEKARRVVRSR